jgi:DNA-binding winged helix-turn-helix (wHTH) protein
MTSYLLGPFVLDGRYLILYRGKEPLPSGIRALRLLQALVERPEKFVTKDELMEAGWPGQLVEESNLTVQISGLRRTLSEEPGGARWIETLVRRGYRYVGPIAVALDQYDSRLPDPKSGLFCENQEGNYEIADTREAANYLLREVVNTAIKERQANLTALTLEQERIIDKLQQRIASSEGALAAVCKVAIDHGVPAAKLTAAAAEIVKNIQRLWREQSASGPMAGLYLSSREWTHTSREWTHKFMYELVHISVIELIGGMTALKMAGAPGSQSSERLAEKADDITLVLRG